MKEPEDATRGLLVTEGLIGIVIGIKEDCCGAAVVGCRLLEEAEGCSGAVWGLLLVGGRDAGSRCVALASHAPRCDEFRRKKKVSRASAV